MSIHSDLMRSAIDVLVAVQGDTGDKAPVHYKPDRKRPFVWQGSSIGAQSGAFMLQEDQTMLKVTRLPVSGPTAALIKGGVTELERDAVLTALGHEWSIDLAESNWGPSMVRLTLYRRPISRLPEAEDRGSVR